ncbi:MAG: FAD-dependent thymidylate synthase [Thermomicrobiales bacterium]|nr:FAD-dependent thymidylate synthase [Thermomicrobiales bacterium]
MAEATAILDDDVDTSPPSWPFASPEPVVTLLREESSQHPFALAVAAAWSCYGGKPGRVETVRKLVYDPAPENLSPVKAADRAHRRERAMKLYADLFAAGHHTTLQHANFVFILDNVSRLAIWSFFHAHPFYNSEQVSQRYREVSGETMATPALEPAAQAIYTQAIQRALAGYRNLTEILSPDMLARYSAVFPGRARAKTPEAERKLADAIQKRSQEVARYVLPLATPAHLYHTVNGLTLLRYHVLANQPDVPAEVRAIVAKMVSEVLAVDPYFLGAPGYPLDLKLLETEDTLEAQALASWREAGRRDAAAGAARAAFDAQLGEYESRLVGCEDDAEHVMAEAVRAVLGVAEEELSDAAALAKVLEPAQNHYLGHPLFLGMQSKLMQTMNHVPFTWAKRISMAEDAQNQRHRGTTGSRPALLAWNSRESDVIVPWAIRQNPAALAEYTATIDALTQARQHLLDLGAPDEAIHYLLPNSQRIRFYESGTLLDYYWKWVKRLCFDAQREIFETALDEVAQVRERYPRIGQYVDGPPCVMRSRAGVAPICPEGERFCGIPVWRNHRFEDLEAKRVI